MKKKLHKIKHKLPQYGSVMFAVGIAIAIISTFINLSPTAQKATFATLIIIGFIVGMLNITNQEVVPFLVAYIAIIMLLGPFFGTLAENFQFFQNSLLTEIFGNIILLVVPATLTVAAKTFFITARNEE